jgi:hypothetical protein
VVNTASAFLSEADRIGLWFPAVRLSSHISRTNLGSHQPAHAAGAPAMADDNENSSGIAGILGFILVFGVINVILYLTTGFVLIPLK